MQDGFSLIKKLSLESFSVCYTVYFNILTYVYE
jgi:hypothetical protein